MGFYIRKAIRVGPLRFNLSKSGVGVSAGIPGLRFGTGPRGNYVHMGRGGLYYRQSLGGPASSGARALPVAQPATSSSLGPMVDIESAPATQMVDSTATDLLAELNGKRKVFHCAKLGTLALIAAPLGAVYLQLPPAIIAFTVAICGALVWYLSQRDQLRTTTVLLYDFDSDAEARFQQVHDAFSPLMDSNRAWHVASHAVVRDAKYHAGAGESIRRAAIRPTIGLPPNLKSNVAVPLLQLGRQLLAFMPERILVFDDAGVGAVAYSDLNAEPSSARFIESEAVPSDAKVVGKTWRFVNKSGGPDRRFKDNREIPICLYDQVHFKSASGLNEVAEFSRPGCTDAFVTMLRLLATAPGHHP